MPTLREFIEKCQGHLTPNEILREILVTVGSPKGSIWLYHSNSTFESSEFISLEAATPERQSDYDTTILKRGQGFLWDAFDIETKLISHDVFRKFHNKNLEIAYNGFDIHIARLDCPKPPLGWLILCSPPGEESETLQRDLKEIRCAVSVLIDSCIKRERIEQLGRVSDLVNFQAAGFRKFCEHISFGIKKETGSTAVMIFLKPQLRTSSCNLGWVSECCSDDIQNLLSHTKNNDKILELRNVLRDWAEKNICNPHKSCIRDVTGISRDLFSHNIVEKLACSSAEMFALGVPITSSTGGCIGAIICFAKQKQTDDLTIPQNYSDHDEAFVRNVAMAVAPTLTALQQGRERSNLEDSIIAASRFRNHELKAPLASIVGNASFVSRYLDDAGATTKKSRLEYIMHDAELCAVTLFDPIDAIGEFRSDDLKPTNVPQLVRRAASALRRIMALRLIDPAQFSSVDKTDEFPVLENTFQIKGSCPLTLTAPRLLLRAIYNLGVNAIKYGDLAKPITFHLGETTVDGDDFITIDVIDWGIGFDETELDRVFQLRFRGERTRMTHTGEGIGLYVVDQVARIHQGQVEILCAKGPTKIRLAIPWRKPSGNERKIEDSRISEFSEHIHRID